MIYTAVSLSHKSQKFKRKKIENYIEIFLISPLNKILKFKKKKIYLNKTKNIVGIDIRAEYPKKPDIKIYNNFNKPMIEVSKNLEKKINNFISF